MEPYQRGLQELGADLVITGRRRDQGYSRANLSFVELGGPVVKVNPLALWSYR